MRITILTIGKPRASFIQEGIDEYMKRMGRFADVALIHLKESADVHDVEKYTKRAQLILLDEKGAEYTSVSFSRKLDTYTQNGNDLVFCIGGADGHTAAVRALPHTSMTLSRLTLPHEIALLVFVETLYRSLTISAGHPYHRE
jgi:23S rRNA (pseudouridine1915-N3)-methyltransferase